LTPNFKYLFNTGFSNAESAVGMRWWIDKYPDKKHIMLILPDFELGHIVAEINAGICRVYGMTVDQEFYMLGNPDMSALGTKVKTVNPDVVCLFEMSPLRAIREAGWAGQFFSVATNSIEAILATASAADIEGFIGTAYPTEFDPPLTQAAADFKDAYTTLFGKWDNPAPSDTALYSAIIAALEQAQSTDPDKVADVLAAGLQWESPCGPLRMVARPDMGNTRTVDSINTIYMKQVVGGKVTLLDTVDLDTAATYFAEYLAQAPPMGPPTS
jgi:ABC-type branched-subunit amino acid transport system substrate-binding protein